MGDKNITDLVHNFNGKTLAGLSALGDQSIGQERFLKVVVDGLMSDAHISGVRTAITMINSNPIFTDMQAIPELQELLVAAAYAIPRYGLACIKFPPASPITWDPSTTAFKDLTADSDITFDKTPPKSTTDIAKYVDGCLSTATLAKAITMIMATKINWWTSNHHTGAGVPLGLTTKTIKGMFPSVKTRGDSQLKSYIDVMHSIGHWASTREVLLRMDIFIPKKWQSITGSTAQIEVTADFMLRAKSLPAGTAKAAVVAQAIRKFGSARVFSVIPRMDDIIQVIRAVKALEDAGELSMKQTADKVRVDIDPRAKYHVGAIYLTESKQEELGGEDMTGLVGSYLFHCKKHNTLTKSPSITIKRDGVLEGIYIQAQSYEQGWDDLCKGIGSSETRLDPSVAKAFSHYTASFESKVEKYTALLTAAGTDDAQTIASDAMSALARARTVESFRDAGAKKRKIQQDASESPLPDESDRDIDDSFS